MNAFVCESFTETKIFRFAHYFKICQHCAFCKSVETVADNNHIIGVQPSDKHSWDSPGEKNILAGADDLDLIYHY